MSQVHITVEYEEMVSLLSKDRNEAFAALMKKVLDAFLLAVFGKYNFPHFGS